MLPKDDGGVVDADLLVYGTKNLRVVSDFVESGFDVSNVQMIGRCFCYTFRAHNVSYHGRIRDDSHLEIAGTGMSYTINDVCYCGEGEHPGNTLRRQNSSIEGSFPRPQISSSYLKLQGDLLLVQSCPFSLGARRYLELRDPRCTILPLSMRGWCKQCMLYWVAGSMHRFWQVFARLKDTGTR